MFEDQTIDILADLGGANSQSGQLTKLSVAGIRKRTYEENAGPVPRAAEEMIA